LKTTTTTTIIRLPEEKKLDKQIDICRFGAKRDNVTVLIERTITRKDGSTNTFPIFEITPAGDLREVPPPSLKATIGARMREQHVRYLEGEMNAGMTAGHERLDALVGDSRDALAADRRRREARSKARGDRRFRANKQRRKGARPVGANTSAVTA
jgi:hypothetical protein